MKKFLVSLFFFVSPLLCATETENLSLNNVEAKKTHCPRQECRRHHCGKKVEFGYFFTTLGGSAPRSFIEPNTIILFDQGDHHTSGIQRDDAIHISSPGTYLVEYTVTASVQSGDAVRFGLSLIDGGVEQPISGVFAVGLAGNGVGELNGQAVISVTQPNAELLLINVGLNVVHLENLLGGMAPLNTSASIFVQKITE